MIRLVFVFVLSVCFLNIYVSGHGRLLDPPSRSSLWRFGLSNATNYNDNQLSCGGFANQWLYQNGKCGVCGDPFQGPRDNEAGGKYALGIISRRFVSGQTIDVSVEITANHHGWFEFRLCPNNDVQRPVTQACLDQHQLSTVAGNKRYNLVGVNTGIYHVNVKLPPGLTCSQCVFQWKWHTGSNYGYDPDGHSCKGCGVQEEFYGCADVAIIAPTTVKPVNSTTPLVKSTTTHSNTQIPLIFTTPTFNVPKSTQPQVPQSTKPPVPQSTKPSVPQSTKPPVPQTTKPSTTKPPIIIYHTASTSTQAPSVGQLRCYAINLWYGIPMLDKWCNDQCNIGNCPAISCKCS